MTLSDVTQNSWNLTATPIVNTIQSNDGALRLNNKGEKCWEKTSGACEAWDGK